MHEIIRLSTLNNNDIASALGVSRQFIHQLVKGQRPIPAKHKKRLYLILKDNLNQTLKECKDGLRRLEWEKESMVGQSK
tara:strand:+ start:209 stop:445 length:237 start_codon:yes stop_codon:yes gene_type:complete